MSKSSDPGHFFQTEASLEEISRRKAKSGNNSGSPIKLRSKLLAIERSPNSERVYVAESGGTVRELEVKSGVTTHVFHAGQAPVTSLAVSSTDPHVLFAGCWNKLIYAWYTESHSVKQTFVGHEDFVKVVKCVALGSAQGLVSAGADGAIIVWNADTGQRLHTLRGHIRGVTAVAIDPLLQVPNSLNLESGWESSSAVVFSGSSDREIRRWLIQQHHAAEIFTAEPAGATSSSATQGAVQRFGPIVEHETSIYALRFDCDGDLWTTSADKSAKRLVRDQGWKSDTTLLHPDFVRDVAILDADGWVVTACRDEEVRVWDIASGSLAHTFSGHFDEVTAVLPWDRDTVLSVSLDNSLRRWNLGALRKGNFKNAEESSADTTVSEHKAAAVLTEEEENELKELMEDSE